MSAPHPLDGASVLLIGANGGLALRGARVALDLRSPEAVLLPWAADMVTLP